MSSTVGSDIGTGWNRRSRAASFSMYSAVLLGRGRSDAMQRASGERGLQEVRGVHRTPLGRPRVHQGVELVDEQDHLARGLFDLLEHRLEALLELAPELGAGEKAPEVEGDDPPLQPDLRNVLRGDPHRESLHHRGLSDPGFPDEDRVVLGASAEDLDDPADLVVPTDHRVELALPGEGGEVAAVLGERLILRFLVPALDRSGVAPEFLQRLFDRRPADAGFLEQLPGGEATESRPRNSSSTVV